MDMWVDHIDFPKPLMLEFDPQAMVLTEMEEDSLWLGKPKCTWCGHRDDRHARQDCPHAPQPRTRLRGN